MSVSHFHRNQIFLFVVVVFAHRPAPNKIFSWQKQLLSIELWVRRIGDTLIGCRHNSRAHNSIDLVSYHRAKCDFYCFSSSLFSIPFCFRFEILRNLIAFNAKRLGGRQMGEYEEEKHRVNRFNGKWIRTKNENKIEARTSFSAVRFWWQNDRLPPAVMPLTAPRLPSPTLMT